MARNFTLTEIYYEAMQPQNGDVATVAVRARPLEIDLDDITVVGVMPKNSIETEFGGAAAQVTVRKPKGEISMHYVADKWSTFPQGIIPPPDEPANIELLNQG